MDSTATAAKLYPPGPAPLPRTALTAPTPTAPSSLETMAAKLYPPAPPAYKPEPVAPAVQAIRQADGVARQLYTASKQVNTTAWAQATHPDSSPAVLEAQRVELAEVAVDIGLSQLDIDRMTSLAKTYALNPPTAAQQRADEVQALTRLREIYGKDAPAALQAGMKLAQRDPRFSGYLAASKLGSAPEVVVKLAELGLSARNRGRSR